MRSTPFRPKRGPTFTEQARREQIARCAIELIAERGYVQSSVSKIAERAGVAKSVVLYHFATKDELVARIVTDIYLAAATVTVPAVEAQETAAGKLGAYIRSNGEYIATHKAHALALLDIWTSFRTAEGLRLDEAAPKAEPEGDLAKLNPLPILVLGQSNGEFRSFDLVAMSTALRQAIDGAVLLLSRLPDFDVRAYCEELVTLFDLATRRLP